MPSPLVTDLAIAFAMTVVTGLVVGGIATSLGVRAAAGGSSR